MKAKSKRRLIVSLLCGLALVCASTLAFRYWYFLETEHHRVKSPDGRWTVVVTKQMQEFMGEVDVRLRVIENTEGQPERRQDILDSTADWADITSRSYQVSWLAENDFTVGGRNSDEDDVFGWRYDGEKWDIRYPEPPGSLKTK